MFRSKLLGSLALCLNFVATALFLSGCNAGPELEVSLGDSPELVEVENTESELRQKPVTKEIQRAVLAAVTTFKKAPPAHGVFVDVKRLDRREGSAFGSVAILTPKAIGEGEESLPEGMLWVATQTARGWEVTLDQAPEFGDALHTVSPEVMGDDEKRVLGTKTTDVVLAGDNGLNLSLPWGAGQAWNLRGGPHGWAGAPRPWSALDLNGGDGRVLSARDGFVYKMCGTTTWLQVRHSGGWQTDYYHLANMVQFADGTWVDRGAYLGQTGTTIACGGSASGAHVHFNLRLNNAHQAWAGRELSGWTVREGAAAYEGSVERSGRVVGKNSLIYNMGVQYQANIEGIGWQGAQANGGTSGTSGQNRRMEAINISLQRPTGTPANADICYEAHVQNIGWQGVRCNAQTAGIAGGGLRMEALKVWLTNPPNRAGVCYRAHVQNIGWQGWVCNGAIAGTTGQSLRIEALQIKITP